MSTSQTFQELNPKYARAPRFYDRFANKLIRDPRDLAFIDLILKSSFLVLPLACFILLKKIHNPWFVFAYIPYLAFALGLFLGPFILMLHNTCHRPLFRKKYNYLNLYIPWILGPFFGETPETYFAHHVGMHHPENNLAHDLSSTLKYRRDSFLDFMRYFSRFFFLSFFELPTYFIRQRRYKLFVKSIVGEVTFYLMVALLCMWNWMGAVCVFVLPFLVARFMMMNGNWAQHAFVDPLDVENSYKNSITCVNSTYNRRCFNDGYHTVHHLKPTAHWLEMPQHFFHNREIYAQNDAIVFEKIDYFVIWIFLMLKKYDWLEKYFVDVSDKRRSSEEIIALLKSRTRSLLIASA